MEKKEETFISKLIENRNKEIAESFKIADGIIKGTSSIIGEFIKMGEEHWRIQNMLDGVTRISMYTIKLKRFLKEFKSANEEAFIKDEIKENNLILKKADQNNMVQKNVFFHVKKYNDFLNEKLNQLQLEKTNRREESDLDGPLSFLINRSQLVALMLMLKDNGILSPMTDYQLAKFMEKNFLYDADKPMKAIMTEISQFRNLDKDPKKQEEYLKDILSNAGIKTNDDLES